MKRVLHIVSSISIDSGVMRVIMNMYRNMNRNNIQFDFLYFKESNNDFEKEINKLGGHCYKIYKPKLSISSIKEIKKFFKDNTKKYIAIHNHEVYLNLVFSPIAKEYGINNIIVHSHTTRYSDKKLNAIRNKLLCIPIKIQKNYKFACSKAAGEFLYGKDSIDNSEVFILNNAIDVNKFRYNEAKRMEVRTKLNLHDKVVIGHVGRFSKQKNHSFMIKVFLEVSKIKPNAQLMLIGTGPLEDEIKECIEQMGIKDKVIFMGMRNDINELMQGMDIFLLPSLYEGLPVVGIEAQASGLPCFMSTEITEEVSICNTKLLNLSKGSMSWSKEILKVIEDFNREDVTSEVIKKNFEIKNESERLERFYMALES